MSSTKEWISRHESRISAKELKALKSQSIKARAAILKMTTLAGSGHPGGSMSSIDLLLGLYSQIKHDPKNVLMPERDRVIISHGHISPAAYSVLGLNGYFDLDQMISEFRLAGSIFEGHVEPEVPGIEWASGNLGQGLSAGCGFALAARLQETGNQVYVFMGDGEQQKGQISEARRFAHKFKLDNLTAIIDYNDLQISGACHDIMPQEFRKEFEANHWAVLEINGHDFGEILAAYQEAKLIDQPVLILAHTVMGKGVDFMENDNKWHGQALPYNSENGLNLKTALGKLGEEDDLERLKRLRESFDPGKFDFKEEVQPLLSYNTGSHINYEGKTDNRSAWGKALVDLAGLNDIYPYLPFAVFDCDLAGSVKTAEFAKNYPDNFFETGIMEHHAAVCAGALSKCGIQTFFSDFGVFGIDETYNQHRLNDINGTNLKIVLTHVGIDVGEDGKTHQCLDYLGQTRNLFGFRCLVPADPNQTDHIIRYLINRQGNYLVAMGRSKIDVIRRKDGSIYYDENYQFEYGKADLLRSGDDASLLVMGSLTGKAVKIADRLAEKGIKLEVWNISTPEAISDEVIRQAAATGCVFTYEDHNIYTGLTGCVQAKLVENRLSPHFKAFGAKSYPVSGKSDDVYRYLCLDPEYLISQIEKIVSGK